MRVLICNDAMEARKIEAARISFLMLDRYFLRMRELQLAAPDSGALRAEVSYEIFTSAWGTVDFSWRYLTVLNTIANFKRREARFTAFRGKHGALKGVRDYIQHVDNEAPTKGAEFLPILGVISWRSVKGDRAFTSTLGTLPKGTAFNSPEFALQSGKFDDEARLTVRDHSIDLAKLHRLARGSFEALEAWLEERKLLMQDELVPVTMTFHSDVKADPTSNVKLRFRSVAG
jgi:hypothetical protein